MKNIQNRNYKLVLLARRQKEKYSTESAMFSPLQFC